MAKISQRIAALETAARVMEKHRRLHDPFIYYRPWSILKDEFYLKYFPEGLFQKPQEWGPIPYDEVCRIIKKYPSHLACEISLGECAEWLFVFHHFSDHSRLYSPEQLDNFMRKELEQAPELAFMLTDEGEWMVRAMLKCPQTFTTTVGIFLDAMKEE